MSISYFRTRLLPLSSTIPRSFSTSVPEPGSATRIDTAVSILLNHRRKTRYNHLKSAIGSPLSPSESAAIILRIRSKPHLALRFFGSPLCSRDLAARSAIIHVAARDRLRPETLSLIRSAVLSLPESDNPLALFQALAGSYRLCGSAPFVFDLLIIAYLQFKKIDGAIEIVRVLRSRKIQPLLSTANFMIQSAARSRGCDAGFEIYKEVFGCCGGQIRGRVSPNVRTFNTLLLAFYREGRLEMAEEVMKEMRRFDCKANVFTYSILMAGFCDEGMIDEAVRVWSEMAGNGIKPDVMAFNTLIKGFCEAVEMEKAEDLFREMGLSEIEPSCATFEHLVRGYCRVKDINSALILIKDMKSRGFEIENSVVNEVIEGLCEGKRVSEGLGFMREEMRRLGFELSRRCYELLIEGLCEEGDMMTAGKMQAEMAGKGFVVNSKIYGDFVEGYRRLGDEETAMRLEKEMVGMGLEKEGD